MFKSVSFFGFDRHPELRACVERSLSVVQDELRSSADRLSLLWNYRIGGPKGTVELELTDDWYGRNATYLDPDDFCDDNEELRIGVRSVHGQILQDYLNREAERLRRELTVTKED